MTESTAPNGEAKDRATGWAVRQDATWSYRPALIATIVAIIIFPVLFLIGYLPQRNAASVVYPMVRCQITQPDGATAGQRSLPSGPNC
jgi:hypothetical protein